MQSMTSAQRWRATYEMKPVDHLFRKEFYIWDTAIERWQTEGMPADADSEKEVPIITLGDDVERLMPLLMHHATDIYHVDDVFNYLGC